MELRITKKGHPNLFRLICENVICDCKAERWFVEYAGKMDIATCESPGMKPMFKFSHHSTTTLECALILVDSQWLQENIKDDALVEFFLIRQKGKKNGRY